MVEEVEEEIACVAVMQLKDGDCCRHCNKLIGYPEGFQEAGAGDGGNIPQDAGTGIVGLVSVAGGGGI